MLTIIVIVNVHCYTVGNICRSS